MNSKIKLEKQENGNRQSTSKPIKTETHSSEQAIATDSITKKVKQDSKAHIQRRNTVDVVTNDRGITTKQVKCESINFVQSVSICDDSKLRTKFTEALPLPKNQKRRRSEPDSKPRTKFAEALPLPRNRKRRHSEPDSTSSQSSSSVPRKPNVYKDPNVAGFIPRLGHHRHEHQVEREIEMRAYQLGINITKLDSNEKEVLREEIRYR